MVKWLRNDASAFTRVLSGFWKCISIIHPLFVSKMGIITYSCFRVWCSVHGICKMVWIQSMFLSSSSKAGTINVLRVSYHCRASPWVSCAEQSIIIGEILQILRGNSADSKSPSSSGFWFSKHAFTTYLQHTANRFRHYSMASAWLRSLPDLSDVHN